MAEAVSDAKDGPIKQELFKLSNDLDNLEKTIVKLKDTLASVLRQEDKILPPPNLEVCVQSSSEVAKRIAASDGRILGLNDIVCDILRNIEL